MDRATGPVVATYSIAACDPEAGQWGVATQSKFLAVGSVVPWASPRVGAIATQAYANPRYGPEGLGLLREGLSAHDVVDRLTKAASTGSSASSTPRAAARASPAPSATRGQAGEAGRDTRPRGTSSSPRRRWTRSPTP